MQPDIHFVPTPPEVVDAMLQLAQVKPGDLLYDLGCGDGRIVIAAAQKYGAQAIGFEIDTALVKEARAKARQAGLTGRVAIQQADIFSVDLSPATVVTLYLLSILNQRLLPRLRQLKPGARVVSHEFEMEGYPPQQTVSVKTADGRKRELYLWVAPFH